jgi:hypothetical protein
VHAFQWIQEDPVEFLIVFLVFYVRLSREQLQVEAGEDGL